jgi:hypothetical protein
MGVVPGTLVIGWKQQRGQASATDGEADCDAAGAGSVLYIHAAQHATAFVVAYVRKLRLLYLHAAQHTAAFVVAHVRKLRLLGRQFVPLLRRTQLRPKLQRWKSRKFRRKPRRQRWRP